MQNSNDLELNEEQLSNVYGGSPRKFVEDEALKSENLYRKTQIDELQKAKEELLQNQEPIRKSR